MIDERSISRYICRGAIYRVHAAYGGELREKGSAGWSPAATSPQTLSPSFCEPRSDEDLAKQAQGVIYKGVYTMSQLEVRQAQEHNRQAVLAFCNQTWEWGDYIAYVWDEWLHDENGVLFVATMDEQPVGVANLRMLNAS